MITVTTITANAGQDVLSEQDYIDIYQEINPKHPAVQRLKYEETHFADWAHLLLEQATLAEGGTLEDPAGFVKRINALMLELSAK